VLGGLLTAFWALPFIANLAFTNDMAYEKMVEYRKNLLPHNLRWLIALAGLGALISLGRRCRVGTFLTIMAGLSALGFRFAPQGKIWNPRLLPFWFLCLSLLAGIAAASIAWLLLALTKKAADRATHTSVMHDAAALGLPTPGRLALPAGRPGPEAFWSDTGGAGDPETAGVHARVSALLAKAGSTTYPEEAAALAAKADELIARHGLDPVTTAAPVVGADEGDVPTTTLSLDRIRDEGGRRATGDQAAPDPNGGPPGYGGGVLAAVHEYAAVGVTLLVLAAGLIFVAIPLHLPFVERLPLLPKTKDRSYVPDWAKWNYNGYERKASYPEYKALIDTMATVGRTVGCGGPTGSTSPNWTSSVRLWRSCCSRTGPMAASARWRVSTSSHRPPRRTTSSPPPSCPGRRRARSGAWPTRTSTSPSGCDTSRCSGVATTWRSRPTPRRPPPRIPN
jgi:hypothetical protein